MSGAHFSHLKSAGRESILSMTPYQDNSCGNWMDEIPGQNDVIKASEPAYTLGI